VENTGIIDSWQEDSILSSHLWSPSLELHVSDNSGFVS